MTAATGLRTGHSFLKLAACALCRGDLRHEDDGVCVCLGCGRVCVSAHVLRRPDVLVIAGVRFPGLLAEAVSPGEERGAA